MKRKTGKPKSASAPVSRKKLAIKDLKAKDGGSVKGGGASVSGGFDISKRH